MLADQIWTRFMKEHLVYPYYLRTILTITNCKATVWIPVFVKGQDWNAVIALMNPHKHYIKRFNTDSLVLVTSSILAATLQICCIKLCCPNECFYTYKLHCLYEKLLPTEYTTPFKKNVFTFLNTCWFISNDQSLTWKIKTIILELLGYKRSPFIFALKKNL